MSRWDRIGEFWFDRSTGELTKDLQSAERTRLPPLPAQLLSLLVQAHPHLLPREDIQIQLWPGVIADCDNNLHFCVRQLRHALGDSATRPTYVETIPRRGYRLIAPVVAEGLVPASEPALDACSSDGIEPRVPAIDAERIDSDLAARDLAGDVAVHEHAAAAPLSTQRRPWYRSGILLGLVALAALASWFGWTAWRQGSTGGGGGSTPAATIAIMPFTHPQPEYGVLGDGRIAILLLERLTGAMPDQRIVGPTTTETFAASAIRLADLIDQVQPDLIVNARYLTDGATPAMLAEIIRASDGAHIWVRRFDPTISPQKIADQIAAALSVHIDGT